jgi:hypothetical protein
VTKQIMVLMLAGEVNRQQDLMRVVMLYVQVEGLLLVRAL